MNAKVRNNVAIHAFLPGGEANIGSIQMEAGQLLVKRKAGGAAGDQQRLIERCAGQGGGKRLT
jgi:hypothetical protein